MCRTLAIAGQSEVGACGVTRYSIRMQSESPFLDASINME